MFQWFLGNPRPELPNPSLVMLEGEDLEPFQLPKTKVWEDYLSVSSRKGCCRVIIFDLSKHFKPVNLRKYILTEYGYKNMILA